MSAASVVFTPPLRQLVDGVATFLAANGVNATVERGITPSHEKPIPGRTNRVIFYGSLPDGSAGSIVKPRNAGSIYVGADPDVPQYSIRALSDWARTVYVSMWAQDIDRPQDEGAQQDAVDTLFTWVQRAVQSVAFGNHDWGSVRVTITPDRSYGLEITAVLAFQHMIPDVPVEITMPSPAIVKGPLP